MIIDPNQQSAKDNYRLMIGSIVPRPIALVSTLSKEGIPNLAPFSFFTGVCSQPPTLLFVPAVRGYDGKPKDTLVNIRETGEFVVNIVSRNFAEEMVRCATDFDPEVDEFEIAHLTPTPSQKITPPRVGEAKISFECQLEQLIPVCTGRAELVLGRIVLFYVADEVYADGRINLEALQPIGRLGGHAYVPIKDTFEIIRKIKPD